MKAKDKTVPLAVLGVVAVLAIVGLILLFSIASFPTGNTIGIYSPECNENSDCASDHYCGSIGTIIRCMPKFQIGVRCFQNNQCSSNTCLNGYCAYKRK